MFGIAAITAFIGLLCLAIHLVTGWLPAPWTRR